MLYSTGSKDVRSPHISLLIPYACAAVVIVLDMVGTGGIVKRAGREGTVVLRRWMARGRRMQACGVEVPVAERAGSHDVPWGVQADRAGQVLILRRVCVRMNVRMAAGTPSRRMYPLRSISHTAHRLAPMPRGMSVRLPICGFLKAHPSLLWKCGANTTTDGPPSAP